MTPFQIVAGGFLAALVLGEALLQIKGWTRNRISIIRMAVWTSAFVCITQPSILQRAAGVFRIGRGADLLLYLLTLSFLMATFYFAHVAERHRRQITQLTRELATKDPFHRPSRHDREPESISPDQA